MRSRAAAESWSASHGLRRQRHGLAPMEEIELATGILDAAFDGRPSDVLGRIVAVVERKASRAIPLDSRRRLIELLERSSREAVPALGGAIGGPLRTARAVEASRFLGLETEGLSSEATDFELARHFVRFAAAAAERAARTSDTKPPDMVADEAVRSAARALAPGLLSPGPGRRYPTAGQSVAAVSPRNVLIGDAAPNHQAKGV
jgi:hypothetical protein